MFPAGFPTYAVKKTVLERGADLDTCIDHFTDFFVERATGALHDFASCMTISLILLRNETIPMCTENVCFFEDCEDFFVVGCLSCGGFINKSLCRSLDSFGCQHCSAHIFDVFLQNVSNIGWSDGAWMVPRVVLHEP